MVWFFVIIIPTPVWVFDLDFDWGVAKRNGHIRRNEEEEKVF